MKQPIVMIGNPVLRDKTRALSRKEAVSSRLKDFVQRMVSTMRQTQGVGLAANQVGDPRRILVMECRGNRRYPNHPNFPLQVYLNARILKRSKSMSSDWEGCLSIPGYRGLVPRSHSLELEAMDLNGKILRKSFKGFEARVIQHEVDHLEGGFYIDRMENFSSLCHLDEFEGKMRKKIPEQRSR